MTARETTFEPAPAAVARIGSVPIEALESLSDPELAGRAAELDERSFSAEYERVVEEHRKRLWQHTVGDPRVRCGLALSSPSLVADLTDPTPSPRRNKRARHLDTSLYRYLARAAGRIEPCGLWTSVALASLGDEPETTVRPCAPKCHVAPDLVPFRDLVRGLAGLEPYRSRGPYRLNPTLQTDAAERWCFARRHPNGELSWTTLPVSGAWSLLARHGKDGRPRSMAALTEALRPAVSEAVGRALLGFGLDAGLLVGGLAFPTRFGTPWEALELVEASLEPSHRAAWVTAREQLVRLCADVERALDAALLAPPGAAAEHARVVLSGQRCTRVALEGLAAALELPCPAIPTAVLRCDETAPFGIDLGHHDRRRIEALLRRWSQLERRHHTHRRWVRSAARAAASAQGGVTSMPCTDAERAEAQTVEPSWCGGPPLGALIVRPGPSGLRTPWVRGLSQAPTVTHARHAYHLADRGDPLLPWFRAAYRGLERRDGVKAFDLSCSTGGSPNLHARPRYVEPALDPWEAASEGPRVDELRVVPGPAPSAVLLAQGGSALVSARVHAAANSQLRRDHAAPDGDVVRRSRDRARSLRAGPRPGRRRAAAPSHCAAVGRRGRGPACGPGCGALRSLAGAGASARVVALGEDPVRYSACAAGPHRRAAADRGRLRGGGPLGDRRRGGARRRVAAGPARPSLRRARAPGSSDPERMDATRGARS